MNGCENRNSATRVRLIGGLAIILGWTAAVTHAQVIYREAGEIRVNTPDVPAQHLNPWPAEQEDAYWRRVQPLLEPHVGKIRTDVHGEAEKWSIPQTLLAYIAGGGDAKALAALQQPGGDADHDHTEDIDFYWSFTLKGQARKYFLLTDHMDPAYVERFREGGKAWSAGDVKPNMELVLALDSPDPRVRTMALDMLRKMRANLTREAAEQATNPDAGAAILAYLDSPMAGQDFGDDRDKWRAWWGLFSDRGWKTFEEVERLINIRPHPKHGIGSGPVGATWNPSVRGFWADARNTDNLRGMRETTAYLFAEETGNEATRKLYKEKLRRTAHAFLEMGMGEWDSTSYHMHSFAAYLNLYDFAEDEQVVGYAKAILDYLSAAGAVKYFHGAWAGPVKRDYGTTGPWDTTSKGLYPYFGAAPASAAKPDLEHAFIFTSSYRPPMALVKLAEKNIDQPFELLNSHPAYENWLPGQSDRPEFFETMYYGTTYQLGTLADGSDGYDTAGFKLAALGGDGVGRLVLAGTAPDGKIKRNDAVSSAGGDRIGQFQNMALLVNGRHPDTHFYVKLPDGAKIEQDGGKTFVTINDTWIMLQPIPAGDATFQTGKIKPKKGGGAMLSFQGRPGKASGFAMLVGDAAGHGSYAAFKRLPGEVVDDGGMITWSVNGGQSVGVRYAGPLTIWRNGKPHDFSQHVDVFQPADGGTAPIHSGWKQPSITVDYGGYTFTGRMTEDGHYISESTGPGLNDDDKEQASD